MRPLQIIILVFAMTLAGCKMGPNYKRPPINAGDRFRGAEQTTTTASIADVPWWEVFRDEQLQAYIREAVDNNTDVQIALARVSEARAIVGVVRADLFPQVFGTANASRTRISNEILKAGQRPASGSLTTPAGTSTFTVTPSKADHYVNLYQGGINLSYELDLWGRLRRATEAARANLLATEYAVHTVALAMGIEVATDYFTLRELDLELEIAERTHQSRLESERLIRLRFEHGRANGLDLERAIGETASTAATIARIQNGIAQTENALSVLIGRNPGDLRRGLTLTEQPIPPEVPPGLPASLVDRRPDVLQAEAGLIALNARVGAAKALFFPQISLTGLLGFESNELNDWLTHDAHTWAIAGNLTQPIFEGGRIYYNYKAVNAQREQALIFYRNTVRVALRQVADALALRKYSYEERIERQKQVDALVNSTALANMRYEGGRSDYLDVLDAEREQFNVELQLAQSELAELISLVNLYGALGGGWDPDMIDKDLSPREKPIFLNK